MRKKYFSLLLWLFAVTVIFISPACKSKEKGPAEAPEFKVMQLKGSTVPIFLDMVGQAEGIPTVDIRARVEGYLMNWSFQEGSMVNKGQKLFTIEKDQYKNTLDYSKADLDSKTAAWEKAKLDVARLKPLLATNAISQNDYDVAVTTEKQTRAAVASSKADLEQATLNLSYTDMDSPITGYIGSVQVRPGNLVGRGESTLLATVSAIDPMYVNFQMNETDYLAIMRFVSEHKGFLSKNGPIKVYLTLADKKQYPVAGEIDFMDRNINPATGTIALRAKVANPEHIIKPGNYCQVQLVLGARDSTVIVPQSALTIVQGKYFAFSVGDSNKVTRVPVLVGRSFENKIVINAGLKPGSRIMLEGFQKFQEGMTIKPVVITDTLTIPGPGAL
ncbi:MAG: efflux RND transporter periplasmic adaptor subunit [Bacteroidetes bacterium]|nr:efflux RND transporter periplasmic adaptor subunit [Bacteroidota bacterium]